MTADTQGNWQIAQQIDRLQAIGDPAMRAVATELVVSVLDLHRCALNRMLEILQAQSSNPAVLQAAFQRDELVRSVLLLHDLHSQSAEERARQMIDDLRSKLGNYGAGAEVIQADQTRIRVMIHSRAGGCGSTAENIRAMVEKSLIAVAPDVAEIVVELSGADKSFVPVHSIELASAASEGIS
jgi:Fe-S cluster biogenesis protein NfuA